MRYYIADLHFDHAALNERMDHRGFHDVVEMNEYMIKQWNSRVKKKDEVVILGDFSMSLHGEEVNERLRKLNGKKYLIKGNHDRYLKDKAFDISLFEEVTDYKEFSDNKRKIICSHYPIFCYNGQYRVDEQGNPRAYMLYGHVHNTYDEYLVDCFIKQTRNKKVPCNMINCFSMYSNYVPLTLEEWIELDCKRRETLKESDFQ